MALVTLPRQRRRRVVVGRVFLVCTTAGRAEDVIEDDHLAVLVGRGIGVHNPRGVVLCVAPRGIEKRLQPLSLFLAHVGPDLVVGGHEKWRPRTGQACTHKK